MIMEFGKRIRELRLKAEMSQEQLAEKFGVSVQAVSKWECSQSYPDIELMRDIAGTFGVTVDYLLNGEQSAFNYSKPDFSGDFPDDDVLRIVQYRGNKLLRKDEYDPNKAILIDVSTVCGCAKTGDIALNVEIWGSAKIDGDVQGNVNAGGSVKCDGINGSVNSGGSINCCGIVGNVNSGGSVNCDGVIGNVNAGGNISCDDVNGNVSACGNVECDDVEGSVTANGGINCGDVDGNVYCKGNVTCQDVDGDVTAEGKVDFDN
ncbi:MAG: helix-turn-helix domain-containing protein [Oscillospiraceae bacterium]|nr:helix-turn-helix domain-containing protein [Oscillospiraceae bacterium]